MNTVIIFEDDDAGYQRWLKSNLDGYVTNARKSRDPKYMVLHKVGCYSISAYNDMAKPGGFTERDFIKVCSNSVKQLQDWMKSNGRPDGSFSKRCSWCN